MRTATSTNVLTYKGRAPIGLSRLVAMAVMAALAIRNLRWALDSIVFDDFEAHWSREGRDQRVAGILSRWLTSRSARSIE